MDLSVLIAASSWPLLLRGIVACHLHLPFLGDRSGYFPALKFED